MEQNDDPTYQAQLFAHWKLLQRLAQNRFKNTVLADQSLDFVLEKLQQDHWSRLRAYRGEARFSTYLAHVVQRLLEDFARHQFGRQRIPDWIQAQGPLWEQVYRLLCLERLSATDVIETLRDAVPGGRPPQVIREAIALIRQRMVNCGTPSPSPATAEQPLVEPEEHRYRPLADDSQAHQLSPEALQAVEERTQLLTLLYGSVLDPAADSSPPDAWRQAAQRLHAALSLNPEERLLLRLIYQDGLSVTDAGRLLGLRTDQVHGRLRRLLQRIRQHVEDSGLARELKGLLQEEQATHLRRDNRVGVLAGLLWLVCSTLGTPASSPALCGQPAKCPGLSGYLKSTMFEPDAWERRRPAGQSDKINSMVRLNKQLILSPAAEFTGDETVRSR